MDLVKLDSGYISGTTGGQPGKVISIFRGIPYAAPPVGDLRWQPPQPVTAWTGIRECTQFSPQAAQYQDIYSSEQMRKAISSEDCLYLNVHAPVKQAAEKLPVMVWFHGGGTRYGNGNLSISNSTGLPDQGIVLVTVNHRLGIFGLFAHQLLSQESSQGVSGNYMFLDMIASLKWVNNNIAAFGGDPDNVTIFGQSGGGLKVATLLASPLAKGLFQRAIMQSGGRNFEPTSLRELESYGDKIFTLLGVDKSSYPLAAARALPWERITEAEQALNIELGAQYIFMGPWHIALDGWFMPESLFELFQTGKRNQVPFVVMSDMGELTGPGIVIADRMITDYLKMLSSPSLPSSRGYAAVFDLVPRNWREEGCVAAHGMEMYYMFGSLDIAEAWEADFRGFSISGAKSQVPLISDIDRKISAALLAIWTQFARTGNPNVKGLLEWPAWEKERDQYLYVSETLQIKSGYSELTKIKSQRSKV